MKDVIGKEIEYLGRVGEVVAVKAGPMILDTSSQIGAGRVRASWKLRIKPSDGGACFWTLPVVSAAAGIAQ